MKIYQIEISNHCNLTCSYCPHPSQHRVRGLMSQHTFEDAIELLLRCGQRTAYLHNFGEPLLHPSLIAFVTHCTDRGVVASFFTNGVLLTESILEDLAQAGLRYLYISEHTRGQCDRVRDLIGHGGYPIEVRDTFRPVRNELHSWAGQVRSDAIKLVRPAPTRRLPCLFERQNAAVVLWDGRVNVCCIDVEGRGVQGTVADYLSAPDSYQFRPIDLCAGCSLMRGDEELS